MSSSHDDVTVDGEQGGQTRRDFVRRGVGLGLGAAALPSLLAACGGSDKGNNSSNNTDNNAGNTGNNGGGGGKSNGGGSKGGSGGSGTVALAPEQSGVPYPADYLGPKARKNKPFGDNKTVFKIVVPEDTTVVGDWNKNSFSAWFEKRTGVKVQFQTVSTANNDMTKVNAMVASGDLPDAFMGIPFTRDQISLYGSQGVFTALDDYITKLAPQLQEAYKNYPDLARLAKSEDGKTYAFPSLNDCFHCHVSPSRALVNKNFVKAGGGKIPETTDEFRAFLKALKDNDADGHGDTVPLAAGVDNAIDRFFMNAFLYNPGDPWLVLNGDKVDFVANKPEWRDALKFLRSLYDDGTLSPQVFTMTSDALQKLGNHPGYARIGVARCYYWGSFMDISYEKNARWYDYVPVPALKGPKGVRYAAWDYYTPYLLNTILITKNCAHPDVLVRWADYQMELEATMGAYAGTKVKNWDWAKKGMNSIMDEQAVYTTKVWPAPVRTSWNQYSAMYRTNDFRLGQAADPKNPTFESALYHASQKPYFPYKEPKKMQLPPLIFSQADAAQIADISTSMTNQVNQAMAQFATAKLDIDDDGAWTKYTSAIDKIGLQQYLQTYQQAYDKQVKG